MKIFYQNHRTQAFYLTLLFYSPLILLLVNFTAKIEFLPPPSSEILLNMKQIVPTPSVQPVAEPIEEVVEPVVELEPIIEPDPIPGPILKPKPEPKPLIKKEKKKQQKKVAQTPPQASQNASVSENPVVSMAYGKVDDPFLRQVKSAIDKAVKYPTIARKMRQEGEIWVEFLWNKNGILSSLNVIRASKHKILNESAIETIKSASKNFPKHHTSVKIQVPIVYKII